MKIGFIGYGSMTKALAPRWTNDHQIVIGGRDGEKAALVAEDLSVRAAPEAEVVAESEVVVLATRHEGVFDAIEAGGGGGAFVGKTVIDINNPVTGEPSFLPTRHEAGSLSEAIAEVMPGAHVIKAFNMCQASVWAMDPPVFDGRPLVTMICGDDADAKATVATLVEAVGSEPLDIGGLSYAASLEHAAGLVIKLLFSGRDPLTVLNLIQPERKPIR